MYPKKPETDSGKKSMKACHCSILDITAKIGNDYKGKAIFAY